jgi:polysaccharide biosynthesis protein PslH
MRLLYVATNVPTPPNNGQAIRSLSLIKALATSGHNLDFLSLARTRVESIEPLANYCSKVDLIEQLSTNLSTDGNYLRRVLCAMQFKSYSLERFRSEPMRERIADKLTHQDYDAIFCDGIYALVNMPPTKVPILLNCHNVEYVIIERYKSIEPSLLKRIYAAIESSLLKKEETKALERVELAMACSSVDQEMLKKMCPGLKVFVVPNVVDTDAIVPESGQAPDAPAPILLFQGGMDWFPNRDAVSYFARQVLPLVQAEYPSVRFVVAGRNPPAEFIIELQNFSSTEFTGTVTDMGPYLRMATVIVVPLRVGGGTRIKILEAGAAGKPIVSSSLGAEGLDFKDGDEILIANSPTDFAGAVTTLLRDPNRRRQVGNAACARVREHHSQRNLNQVFEVIFSDLRNKSKLQLGI